MWFYNKNTNFLENTLVYCNQGTIWTLKAGDYAVYLDYVILGQIIPANNSSENKWEQRSKRNCSKLFKTCSWNVKFKFGTKCH